MILYHISAKKLITRCTFSMLAASLILCPAVFSGCSAKTENVKNTDAGSQDPISATAIKLNTAVTVTIYDSQDRELLTECMNLCDKYEKIFSRTADDSELYQLNHRELTPVKGTENTYQVSASLAELVSKGLDYSVLSEGAFDIAIEPLTSLWDFTAENPKVPKDSLIQAALPKCNYHNISVDTDKNEITLKTDDTAIELGAIAKGYIADRLKEYLVSQGVESAIINLGGNVLCIGSQPDGEPFRIGIQKPFASHNETVGFVEIDDASVVSSGVYERCFTADGKNYHHLLDPRTGYPYDNGLISVVIICPESVDGDALSTTCFSLGLEKGMELLDSTEDAAGIFITEDYELHFFRRRGRTLHL